MKNLSTNMNNLNSLKSFTDKNPFSKKIVASGSSTRDATNVNTKTEANSIIEEFNLASCHNVDTSSLFRKYLDSKPNSVSLPAPGNRSRTQFSSSEDRSINKIKVKNTHFTNNPGISLMNNKEESRSNVGPEAEEFINSFALQIQKVQRSETKPSTMIAQLNVID